MSASTGAKWVGPKESGTATLKRPQRSPAGRIVSLATSISAQTFGCMVPKRDPGFCESGAAGSSCKKLDAKLRFKPDEPPTDD
ncbi:hypothetical protein EFR01_49640 [Sinorhizobium fredii]|nr:hypothetical protein EFR01_49640 [Sinorhizobium fredii]GLS09489.1 hypothetical protein GCM10007864_31190 [Sinorhizobium fredii]